MFNKSFKTVKNLCLSVLITFSFLACDEDVKLAFGTQRLETSTDANIAINYPKATGTKTVAENINAHIEHVIANEMNMADTPENNISLADAVSGFDNEYKAFKKDFEDTNQQWEVKVDGNVVYESAEVICISIQSYIDTGGAHGNSRLTYLNFNPETGNVLKQEDLISNLDAFKKIAENAFKTQTKPKNNEETIEDFFYGEDFQLPANIGFTTEGLVLLYNNYEIASYAQGTTKIVLPYDQLNGLLTVQ